MTDKRPMTIDDLHSIKYVEDPQISPSGEWIAYVLRTPDRKTNGYTTNIYVVATAGGDNDPIQLTRTGKDSAPRWSPDGGTLAFTSRRNGKPQIYLLKMTAMGGEPRALTSSTNGASQVVWSPDGEWVAYTSAMNEDDMAKEDSGEKPDPPSDELEAKHRKERRKEDEKRRFEPRHMTRIPYRQGTSYMSDRYPQVYIIRTAEGLEDNTPQRLTSSPQAHTINKWAPDGSALYISRTPEPHMDEPWVWYQLYRLDVATGEQTALTPPDDGFSTYGGWPSPDGQWVAFLRRESGSTDDLFWLAVMPAEGGDVRELTRSFDRSTGNIAWSEDSAQIFFVAGDQGDAEIYRVALADDAIEKVVEGRIEVQSIDTHTEGIAYVATTPLTSTDLYWFDGSTSTQVTDVNRAFLDEVIVQETHEIRYEAPDGTEIQGWYILPVGYEEGKTYPLALNIHGGPHVMWGPSAKTMFHEWQTHAAEGYVVFYCNPRGSNGYGHAFNSAIHGYWGPKAMPDVMAGVDQMIEMGLVDEKRMAITGGSYGGYLTGWIIGQTERFAAAVPQRGVYNIASFYGTSDVPILMSSEFDGDPWEPEAFQRMWDYSPLSHAHKVTTPTLIIHAENDFRVPIEQAEQYFAFIRRSGGTVEMWRYPRDGHELSRSGEPRNRIKRLEKMIAWFNRYTAE